ncbi:MAG: helix-hairpin-helix domain-containing protein [Phycisphaerae bacterium]|nr:helix-hairpin-helix domain-containing protein [Phycisphaerae bacterium]MDD5381816.1 helix-hairpin-helix domain-containing protein [Phycisphaerae bacterium]
MTTDSFIQRADTLQNKIQSFAFCLALSAAVLISVCFTVSIAGGFEHPGEIRIESQVNPNYAPRASLARLPGVGNRRAEEIAAYRENFSDRKVFRDCEDLQKVKGIGPKTAEDICEWLKFE